ncbi:TPA: packaged DNA stabilization protein [Serratia marcescens]
MPTLPLAKGLGKDYRNADYVDLLPVNMLATPKEVLNAAGYLRSFPGVTKKASVTGTSRGVQFNTAENIVYRVLGGRLYRGETDRGAVPGDGRVSLAHSAVSQSVAASGVLTMYRYDGTVKTLQNWPEEVVTPAESNPVKDWISTDGTASSNKFSVTAENAVGSFLIKVTPKTSTGASGALMEITETQWGANQSQDVSTTAPYITDLKVIGVPNAGTDVAIEYTLNIPSGVTGVNASEFVVTQEIAEIVTKYPQYDIGRVRDVCRSRGRYVWVKEGTQTFGVTDLEDESHPDRFRPFYSAESQPDGILGCGIWRDFVVMFGSSTIEYFSLTGAADTSSAIYVAQPSLMVNKGIAGTYCKTVFGESFAFISHQATGAPSIYLINSGQASPIASASVEKVLRSYTSEELATGVLESVRFDGHELLLVHLPRHVLCYDAAASQNGPQWCILKTGLRDDVHRAIDYMFEGNRISVGDKLESLTGALRFDSSAQYDKQAEHLLYTPMFKADNARVFDFQLEASTGVSQYAERLFISASADGINYGREQLVGNDAPFIYDRRVLWRRIGRVWKNIGFKVRIVTRSPVTLSDCTIRVE